MHGPVEVRRLTAQEVDPLGRRDGAAEHGRLDLLHIVLQALNDGRIVVDDRVENRPQDGAVPSLSNSERSSAATIIGTIHARRAPMMHVSAGLGSQTWPAEQAGGSAAGPNRPPAPARTQPLLGIAAARPLQAGVAGAAQTGCLSVPSGMPAKRVAAHAESPARSDDRFEKTP